MCNTPTCSCCKTEQLPAQKQEEQQQKNEQHSRQQQGALQQQQPQPQQEARQATPEAMQVEVQPLVTPKVRFYLTVAIMLEPIVFALCDTPVHLCHRL
jgi:hypothetical protein